jgi:hypothetical protein
MKYLFFSAVILLMLVVFSRQKTSVAPAKKIETEQVTPRGTTADDNKINGLTFVAPPEPFSDNPIPAVTNIGANWIAVIPYAFTRPDVPNVRYNENGRQWWGEKPVGIRESIRLAHEAGVKVMLKPQVWIPGDWTGNLDFATDASWEDWEISYERYILRFASLADTVGAEMFCIGTEFRTSIEKRPQFWTALIKKIKGVYHGKLTYSSNWDDWDKVPFWSELDYIGLGGYFPLVDATLPEVKTLKEAWAPIRDRLKTYSRAQKKPVLFTEWGYLSVDGCGWRNWELEQGIEARNINEQAQANCMEAMLATFQPEDWWAGSFLWKWFPNMRGHEGYPERDYTPQGKLAEETLKRWYK